MKMFLTRLGFNSKAVVTGDITQVDLPSDRVSGLIEAREILREIPGIQFVYFDERDVVRHRLVQEIIKAYDRHQHGGRPLHSPEQRVPGEKQAVGQARWPGKRLGPRTTRPGPAGGGDEGHRGQPH
jgi:phosphate starvation-inducible PhoH-like protein